MSLLMLRLLVLPMVMSSGEITRLRYKYDETLLQLPADAPEMLNGHGLAKDVFFCLMRMGGARSAFFLSLALSRPCPRLSLSLSLSLYPLTPLLFFLFSLTFHS